MLCCEQSNMLFTNFYQFICICDITRFQVCTPKHSFVWSKLYLSIKSAMISTALQMSVDHLVNIGRLVGRWSIKQAGNNHLSNWRIPKRNRKQASAEQMPGFLSKLCLCADRFLLTESSDVWGIWVSLNEIIHEAQSLYTFCHQAISLVLVQFLINRS